MTMFRRTAFVAAGGLAVAFIAFRTVSYAAPQNAHVEGATWNPRAAAGYLDGRMEWWLKWPNAQRDHNTSCVSCHTALPYALARPALQATLHEGDLAAPHRAMLGHVQTRVRLWNEVEPFYPDQTRGLPKSSESRGTEAVLNAVVLSARDAAAGTLSAEADRAFANMWALQFKAGDLKGAWAWLNFHYEPWEAPESPYYGAAIAAIAVASAPGGYAQRADIHDQLALLRDYVQRTVATERLFNQLTALWASGKWQGLLTDAQQQTIVDAAFRAQRGDGGWATASLGTWKRVDSTALDTASDGYATGVAVLALAQAGVPRNNEHLSRAIAWLVGHQDPATGMWRASSLNKDRDPSSDVGKFMSDAATAYASLALIEASRQSTVNSRQ
jgi:squalene-hopene/tetraprenyl-beta-curcumene cyclase